MISIVVPVYNVVHYLERCVLSVLRQTYKDTEIILVDDGSTDDSGELCDKLAMTDARIRVIHQENQGLSGARNTGIRFATGEYIAFIDSDDEWLLNDGLEQLVNNNNEGKDLIVFKGVNIWKDGRRIPFSDYDVTHISRLPNAQSVFSHLVDTQLFQMSACFLLVRRKLLIDEELYFPSGLISEDVQWSLILWQHVRSVCVTNLEFYGYHHHSNSISTTLSLRVYESYDKIFSYWKVQCDNSCQNAAAIRAYLSLLWVSISYVYYKLKTTEKPIAFNILQRHSDLLLYATPPKSRRVAKMLKVLGVKNTVMFLGQYWQLRNWIKGNALQSS
jgi:glycosyltransferase involved in cell wall biosynthesis